MKPGSVAAQGRLFGAIEAGGTKFNCALADESNQLLAEASFPTATPEQTLVSVSDFFRQQLAPGQALAGLGIACFGPVDLTPGSPGYGAITKTPKAGWSGIQVRDYFARSLAAPVAFETDVNGAALGEMALGAARGCKHFVYVTVGTGIGAGVVVNGQLLQGQFHPEVGHMLMPQAEGDNYAGCCPFHRGCLEGLASGTSLNQRWQANPAEFVSSHQAWAFEAYYLAAMCVNLTQCYGPQKIVLGGGVMQQAQLFPAIRREFARLINGYAPDVLLAQLDSYIVPSTLGGRAGIYGCLEMARSLA